MNRMGNVTDVVASHLDRRPCRDLLAGLNEAVVPEDWPIIVIEPETPNDGSLAELVRIPGASCVTDREGRVRDDFGAQATPHTFLVRDGRIADQQLGAGLSRVLAMLSSAGHRMTARA